MHLLRKNRFSIAVCNDTSFRDKQKTVLVHKDHLPPSSLTPLRMPASGGRGGHVGRDGCVSCRLVADLIPDVCIVWLQYSMGTRGLYRGCAWAASGILELLA